ncbi:HAMP domain-containing sensor histidine kinase [Pedobacter frigiditerrae]|uniref:sensor histidine kinase n=1 Tax=Pedobacter frigiditerrae TaxID=2530452 RepID=UPI0029300803|nr:HAMP domain-containing sensor histidine kinase [Pedobacter frigiditerrae]
MLSSQNFFKSKNLIGHPKLFSLEERIFNTFCIIAFVTMCFEVPFNYYIGLMVPSALCLFGVFASATMFYFSRFKRKSSLCIKAFAIICNLTFTINYFFNSGIFGPNLLLFSLAFLLVIAIIPKKEFKIWVPINIVLVLSILVVEYFNPSLIEYTYNGELSKVIDFAITYLVVVIITYFSISYIRKNYDYERSSVLDKSEAIAEQSLRILAQKEELELLNSQKDKLFSIVTHDIRMPLNSIQSYLELLTETDLEEDERKMLKNKLLQITKDTSDMLTNVLSWSKTQMEGTNTDLKPLNVLDSLINGLNVEKTIAEKKGVALSINSDEDIIITADHNMFQLVVRNLVNNAIKFTPKGGEVKISVVKRIGNCLITIQDNGLGIDEAQQTNLFKLKASSTFGTNNERGIGLGLLLCKEFTDLQNGEIWFESTAQKGSAFFLSFELVSVPAVQ